MRWFAATVVALALVAVLPGAAPAKRVQEGTLHATQTYNVYLPHGYERGDQRYPVLYLLHGRGDTMQAWTQVKSDLDALIAKGTVPAVIAVMPDAPWSERGNYYVDSQHVDGFAVETALTRDLVAHVDATYRTAAHRQARLIGGYSMGGFGAIRYALAHPDLFAHALVLSPAVYTPQPPADSSARGFGAFGNGDVLFDEAVYARLNYPALLSQVDDDLPVRLFIAVGDDEWAGPEPQHDLDFEAAKLYNAVRRVPGIAAQFRVLDGGHDWSVWRAGFAEGLSHLGRTLSITPPMGLPGALYGSPTANRAGGVAAHPDGSVTLALGGQDAVVKRVGGWTVTFGADGVADRLYGVVALPDGGVVTGGYSGRDMLLARVSATGEVLWRKTFGDPAQPDRIYGLTAVPGGDGVYVTGYTGSEKQVVLARVAGSGEIVWQTTFGEATSEDKGFAVAATASEVYVVGTFGIAAYAPDGARRWAAPGGMLAGVAIDGSGRAVATGADLTTIAYDASGKEVWRAALGRGTGADVVALPDGGVAVAGFSDAVWTVPAGAHDVVVIRLDRRGRQTSVLQFGTGRADGADAFSEENLYAAYSSIGRLLVTGLSGDGDVFFGEVGLP
ncbi:alpha/beta hydrolase-fold protein [Allorhizocola rhizosphaerae]|uniref:alpha/beta hydrolase-fold protein n=1 Tax=Allorhizocola rhizosphaerae TaxID=1872709 RepID=UPI000E3E2947|nr:alpha/beta hydrolase-fold protein [Allorhizocola rhizosphaerae]